MDPYVFLSFRQIHVVVYDTTVIILPFTSTSNFRTYSMHERHQNQTSHYSRQIRYFLPIDRAMEQNQILQVTSSKGKACRVHIAPHTVGPARRSSGNVCGVAFSLTSGTAVEQTDYRQNPTPPTA